MESKKGFLEQNLAESQGKEVCRILFDGSPDAVFLGDVDTGTIIDANPAAEQLTGRPLSELIGIHQSQLHPPRLEDASRRIFRDHVAAGGGDTRGGPELHYVLRADGSEVPVEITAKVIRIRGKRVLQGFFRDVSKHLKTESALQESEKKFKTLTEKSRVGVYLIQDDIFRYVNPEAARIFGYTPGEIIDKMKPTDFVIPEDLPLARENIRKRINGEIGDINYGFRGKKKDGSPLYIEVFGTRTDYQGKPAIIGTLLDVTERHRTQQDLQKSEERYRTLVDNLPIGVIVYRDRKIRFLNRKLAEIGELPDPSTVIGHDVFNFVHPDSRAAAAERIKTLIITGRPLPPMQLKTMSPRGKVFDMEVTSIPISYEGEDCVMSIFQDLTARKQAEEGLRESEERYRTLATNVPAGIVVHSGGVIRYCNCIASDLLRLPSPDDLTGRNVIDFIHPDSLPEVKGRITSSSGEGESFNSVEEKVLAADGSVLEVETSSVPITYMGERCVMAILQDITARKRAENALQEAHSQLTAANEELERRVMERTSQLADLNKELEAFSYSAAHDMVAPLRRINIFSDLLEKESALNLTEEQRENIKMIHKSVAHMMGLVDGLLNLSTTGRRPLEKEPVVLSEILGEVISDIKAETHDRKIEWSTQALPQVLCDRAMIRQVLANLISNSVKYTSSRETALIKVTYELRGGEHVVCVRDNGVGFSMENQDRVFGVFQRLHKPEEFSGTGIGLSIVKRIIARHGGRVWAESAPDKGAAFWFTLPAS